MAEKERLCIPCECFDDIRSVLTDSLIGSHFAKARRMAEVKGTRDFLKRSVPELEKCLGVDLHVLRRDLERVDHAIEGKHYPSIEYAFETILYGLVDSLKRACEK